MTLTANQAIDLLHLHPAQYATPDQLRALAAQVDADSPGRLTVLYSGDAAKGLSGNDVIKSMVEAGEDIRAINKSQIAEFLESDDFNNAAAKAHGLQDIRALNEAPRNSPVKTWLYHPTNGLWADASARFADLTVGEVRAIVPDALPSRTFGEVELPRILTNPNVTTIEGIPREALASRQNTHGTQAIFDMIAARSREHVGELRIPVNQTTNHTGQLLFDDTDKLKLDSRAYFEGTVIQGKTPAFTDPTRPLAGSMNPPTQYVVAGQQHLQTWQAELTQSRHPPTAPLSGAAKITMGLGAAATAYDTASTGQDIKRALDQDNIVGAQSHLIHFGARNIGGWAGAVAGLQAGAQFGPPHPLARAGTTLIGGIGGAVAGEKIAGIYDDHRINNQKDHTGQEWVYLPEHPELGWQHGIVNQITDEKGETRNELGMAKAPPEIANELDYKASTVSVQLTLGSPPTPRDPYSLPASPQDTPSLRESPWVHDPQTKEWTREVAIRPVERQMGLQSESPGLRMDTRTKTALPSRASELERQSGTVIAENIANTPAGIAARYEAAYRQYGWEKHGPIPETVTNAREPRPNVLTASDGRTYQRDANGEWTHDGVIYDSQAKGNIRNELNATQLLQPVILIQLRMMGAQTPPQPDRVQHQEPGQPSPAHGKAQKEVSGPTASAPPPVGDDPRDPSHQDYKLYCQTRDGVHKLDATLGRKPDAASDRLTASLLVEVKRAGLTQVDHVVFNPASKDLEGNDIPARQNIFAVQDEMEALDMKRARLPTAQAVATPEQDSFQQLTSLNRDLARQQAQERQLAQEQQRDQNDPTQSGPKMS